MSASEARKNPDRLAHRRASDKLKILQERLAKLNSGPAYTGTFNQGVHQPGSDVHSRQKAYLAKEILKIKNSPEYHEYENKLQTKRADLIDKELKDGTFKPIEGSGIVQGAPSEGLYIKTDAQKQLERNRDLINFSLDPNNPRLGLGPFGEGLKSLHIDWKDGGDTQKLPFNTDKDMFAPEGHKLNEELLIKSMDSIKNIEYPDVTKIDDVTAEDGTAKDGTSKDNLTIAKPGERYKGDDPRFKNKDGVGERIIGAGASYGVGRKEWASMSKSQKRAAMNKAAMARKRLRQGG